ncbi:unnamed protein product [Blepharisma stoltei]|uniref:Uncharacterized protein n=1 Tax=Blepharisma stoltei TaxID=1481888 RepID=A0AAU9JJJ1_9CILI|nr:unnamed protein product [Blepharisma stoltei]
MSLHVTGQGCIKPAIRPLDLKPKQALLPISIEALSHPNLDGNAIFQDLKSKLTSFYQSNHHHNNSKQWLSVFHSSLYALLNEVKCTQDKEMQDSLLQKVSNWYYSKISTKHTMPETPEVGKDSSPGYISRLSTDDNSVIVSHHRGLSLLPDLSSRSPSPPPLSLHSYNWSLSYEKPRYAAFTSHNSNRPITEAEINLEKRLEKIKSRERQRRKVHLFREKIQKDFGSYQGRKNEEFSKKMQMIEENYRERRIKKFSEKERKYNTAHIDFSSIKKEDSDEESSTDEEASVNYSNFNKVGRLRNLYSRLIGIEEVPYRPKKRRNISLTINFNNVSDMQEPNPQVRNFHEQINETFLVKSKLAHRGIRIPIKELEEGIVGFISAGPVKPSDLPKGGESLLENPTPCITKEKSKKKKPKKD